MFFISRTSIDSNRLNDAFFSFDKVHLRIYMILWIEVCGLVWANILVVMTKSCFK